MVSQYQKIQVTTHSKTQVNTFIVYIRKKQSADVNHFQFFDLLFFFLHVTCYAYIISKLHKNARNSAN